MALEKTMSVSSGLSDPETTVGTAFSEDEPQFSRAEGAGGIAGMFSRDNVTFQSGKAQLISGSGWLIT